MEIGGYWVTKVLEDVKSLGTVQVGVIRDCSGQWEYGFCNSEPLDKNVRDFVLMETEF